LKTAMKKKATNKQILDAYGQSLKNLKDAKKHDDRLRKLKKG